MFGSACRPMRVGKLSPSGRLLQKAILSISGPTERAGGRGRRRRREGKETQGAFEVANLIIIYMYMYSNQILFVLCSVFLLCSTKTEHKLIINGANTKQDHHVCKNLWSSLGSIAPPHSWPISSP